MKLEDLTVLEAAAAIRRGDFSEVQYADALLQRIDAATSLGAFIHCDRAGVRQAAIASAESRRRGSEIGPLHGVPLAFKDNIDTAQYPTTGGTPGLAKHRPARNAPIVEKFLAAGAIVLGKTNMHELAFGITNNNGASAPARNPYDPERIPGGSSGGTAVAVAARLAPGGIGTDTGGSVRVPAALCGLVGFRPTSGRWPQAGIVPISHTRDTPGPMTRSVADCALLDGIVTGGATEIRATRLAGLRLGVPRGYFWEPLDADLKTIVENALERFRRAGVVLVERDVPNVASLSEAAGFPIALYETVAGLDRYLAEHGIDLDFAGLAGRVASPDVAQLLQGLAAGGAIPEPVYREALDVHRPALREMYRQYFREQNVSAVLFPTTPLPAAKIGEDETVVLDGVAVPTFLTYIRNTDPASIAGIPGISLPAGMTPAGLPVGLELDAAEGNDELLHSVAAALQPLLPTLPPPPSAFDLTTSPSISAAGLTRDSARKE